MSSTTNVLRAVVAAANTVISAPIELGMAAKRAKDGMETPARDAKNAADAQRRGAEKIAAEQQTRQSNEDAATTATADAAAARSRQRARSGGSEGRRGTILTGPLGLVDDAQIARKTILGA